MKVADSIWQRLSKEVDTVFYLPGGGCAPLVDSLGVSGLKHVCCLHEAGAGFAAVGYAQHHGFGVCLVTSGPGATNAVTPCLAAWTDSVPVLFISGQVMVKWMTLPNMRTRGTQEAPTADIVKPIVKAVYQPRKSSDVMPMLEDLITLAKDGRQGGVWFDVPMEIQTAVIE